jgi:hypothetical protein
MFRKLVTWGVTGGIVGCTTASMVARAALANVPTHVLGVLQKSFQHSACAVGSSHRSFPYSIQSCGKCNSAHTNSSDPIDQIDVLLRTTCGNLL